jgi:hypothetical protein
MGQLPIAFPGKHTKKGSIDKTYQAAGDISISFAMLVGRGTG